MRFFLLDVIVFVWCVPISYRIKGILRKNMSLMNVRLLGVLPRIECIAALMACIVTGKASSMYSLMLAISWGGSNKFLGTCPTVWCNLLHTALDWGFYAVVHMSLMWQFCNKVWNSSPACEFFSRISIQCCGHGYSINQHCANFCITWSEAYLLSLTSSNKLGTVSITVSASNLFGFPWTWTFHGPTRSTAHPSKGIDWTSRCAKNPYPLPSNKFLCQKSQLRLSTIWRRPLW